MLRPLAPISSIQHYLFISLAMRKTDFIRMLYQPREQRRQEREDSPAASKHPPMVIHTFWLLEMFPHNQHRFKSNYY